MAPNKKNKNKNKNKPLPLVSLCTPTFNRRPFFNALIKSIENQDYPKNLIEWIIVDDGSDKIEDLVKDIDFVKYYSYDEKLKLGNKRNIMHDKCDGDIIIYFDDDDYYPPERISHAVKMLQTHPKALCGGSSELNIYFNDLNKIIKFGPYGEKHATAGTFAFKKELLKTQRYKDDASLAEEKFFLNDYTIPFVQFESKKTILVVAHSQNTFDKRKLLNNLDKKGSNVNTSDLLIDNLINDQSLLHFYKTEIHELLLNYKEGDPGLKPDVMSETKKILERLNKPKETKQFTSIEYKDENIVATIDNEEVVLTNKQIYSIFVNYENEKKMLIEKLNSMQK